MRWQYGIWQHYHAAVNCFTVSNYTQPGAPFFSGKLRQILRHNL